MQLISRPNLNAALGVISVYVLGVFLIWFPLVVLQIPQPTGPVANLAFTGIWQTATTIVLPCAWVIWRLGLTPGDLGLTKRNLLQSTILGCGLYSLAFVAFIQCSAIESYAIRNVSPGDAIGLVAGMSLVAAGTDIATRGYILLTLTRYTHVVFAVIVQNLTWYLGHVWEINLLASCLGTTTAIGLTLTLGILGDVIALRTRNVVGLALAHILLNIVLSIYIRQL